MCADELAADYKLLEELTDTASPMGEPMQAIHAKLQGLKTRLRDAASRGASLEEIKADQGAHRARIRAVVAKVHR